MSVTLADLELKYRHSADPWGFRTSPYEQEKFVATRNALARTGYRSALELGCGNGALAEKLAPMCVEYVGVDGVARAVEAAREAVPSARFIQGLFPCDLPQGDHDLLVLSEILYFLDEVDIAALAGQIKQVWPRAEIHCVTYLGPTGNALQGAEALDVFCKALGAGFQFENVKTTTGYRLDRRLAQETFK